MSRQLSAALGQEGGLAPALPDQRDSQVDYFFTVEGLSSLRVSSQLRAAQGQEGGSAPLLVRVKEPLDNNSPLSLVRIFLRIVAYRNVAAAEAELAEFVL